MQNKELINAFVKIGFTEEEAVGQLSKLGEIIEAIVFKKVTEENPGIEITDENFESIIKEKYQAPEKMQSLLRVAEEATKGYLDAITNNMLPLKRQAFVEEIAQIVAGSLGKK